MAQETKRHHVEKNNRRQVEKKQTEDAIAM
jgi:hypothetical protein